MSPLAQGDMPVEKFREHGHQLVDWIADHFERSLGAPVLARIRPGAIRTALPADAPEAAEPFDRILQDFERILVPGLTQWSHPRFFAYFPCGFSSPGVLADFLSTAVSQQAMLWRTSPAATELEEVALGWLRRAMRLPDAFEGVIYDTASTGAVHALAAARHARSPEVRARGLARRDVPSFRVYASEHAHSAADKAVIVLGLGHENLRRIHADSDFAMRADALAEAIREDRRAGFEPLAVVATAGTTSTASIDPIAAIADICRDERAWLHVDAAYAGAAMILPECRPAFDGIERADSLVVNAHKWLFTPFDLSVFYCRHMDVLRGAFALTPEFLRTSESGEVRNLMDTGFQLGRRFRALKLWVVMRTFGLEGLRARLREHMRLARLFAEWLDQEPGFERVSPVSFGVVCFRAVPPDSEGKGTDAGVNPDQLNAGLLEAVNETGEVFLSHTVLDGRYVLRFAVGNIRTTEADVRRAWELVRGVARTMTKERLVGPGSR